MFRALSALVALFLLAGLAGPVAARTAPRAAAPPAPQADQIEKVAGGPASVIVPDRVAVAFRDGVDHAEALAARGFPELRAVPAEGRAALGAPAVVATNGRPVADVIAELQADPVVAWAEPVYQVTTAEAGTTTAVAVNDTKQAVQYSLDRMKVRDAWSLTRGANNVIAVLDTGVSRVHADLAGRMAANPAELNGAQGVDDDRNGFIDDVWGWDFCALGTETDPCIEIDSDPADDNRHGTWVAGIIAANSNNGQGIAGISWSDRILSVKVMNQTGYGDTPALAAGIRYAANRGASIINMSVGGFPYSQAVADAVAYAWGKGAVLVGAAGNTRLEETYYPASYNNVVSVSATQTEDGFAHWSSWGDAVDVSAPGADIWTTHCQGCSPTSPGGTGYAWVSGTSFATPNVAGVIALIRARYPTLTNQQVVDRLIATVDDLGFKGRDNRFGHGRVNAHRAVGGSPAGVAAAPTDSLEANNTFATARAISLGTTVRPLMNPAGDVDFYAVDVPRAGSFTVSVTPVTDNNTVDEYRSTWSYQPVDPVLEVFDIGGTLLRYVDDAYSDVTEVATIQAAAATRYIVKVSNWFPNGSPTAYSVTTAYVDNVAPGVTAVTPPNASVTRDGSVRPTVTWDEAVTGVSSASLRLLNAAGSALPATVSYDASRRRATIVPSQPLEGGLPFTISATTAIRDVAGNAMTASAWRFTTGRVTNRIAGPDRYATAAAVSASRFAAGVPVAYVALGTNFPDALAAGPAAAARGGPVLLVTSSRIPAATQAELTRLRPGRIVVVGSAGVIIDDVLRALRSYTAGSVTRLAGSDRYATAAAISRDTFAAGVGVAYVAAGGNFPDALAGGAAAASQRGPVLLTRNADLPAATASELARLRPQRIVVLGSAGVVSDGVLNQLRAYSSSVTRLAGPDRYATAVAVSRATKPNGSTIVYVATGTNFPDGLAGDPVAGLRGAPLLLLPSNRLPDEVAEELRRLDPSTVIVLGSDAVVSQQLVNAIGALWP